MPLKRSDTPTILADLLGEAQLRMGDLFSAFTSEQAVVKEFGSEDFLRKLAQLAKKVESIDVETLKAVRFVLESTVQMYKESFRRRAKGEYEVDEFGYDEDFMDLVRPLMAFLYKKWWRVTPVGVQNIPLDGPALLVANHSGVLPWDGAMIAFAAFNEPEKPRLMRALYLDWFQQLPFVAPLLARTGQILANPENAERVLRRGHLACVFPEGIKGVGKLFKDRYKLARFGRGGFVRVAIRAKAPLIPVSVVGAEEIYPNLVRADWLGKPIGAPFFPLTPLWPWFGLLGLMPLPSKWTIEFGKPIPTAGLSERDAENFLVVSRLTHKVRDSIQQTLQKHLIRRKGVFL